MADDFGRDLGRLEGKVETLMSEQQAAHEEMRRRFDRLDITMAASAEDLRLRLSNHGRRLRMLELWRSFLLGAAAIAAFLLGAWKTLMVLFAGPSR